MSKQLNYKPLYLVWVLLMLVFGPVVNAQDLESDTYRLISPSLGGPLTGPVESANFRQLFDSVVGAYTTNSDNFTSSGGFQPFNEANVPILICFETDTDNLSTFCQGLPGSDGMKAVCSELGCFDRAKVEIDSQNNPVNTLYALQVSDVSDFSNIIGYVNPTTRYIDNTTLTLSHFAAKCEWEGTTEPGVCVTANTTYQRYNILNLQQGTEYYIRPSALIEAENDAEFSQTPWGPGLMAETSVSSISIDLDIAPDTSTPTALPHIIDIGTTLVDTVTTSQDMIVLRLSTNGLSGLEALVRGENGALKHTVLPDTISSVNADLASAGSGYGLRNRLASNSAQNTGTIGSVTVYSTPSDFTDSGATHKVGQVGTALTRLLNSGNLPLDQATAGFEIKVKPASNSPAGEYQETIRVYIYGSI